jgi:4-hydroxybenzoate polyprenyltransferase
VTGSLGLPPLLLYAGSILWTIGYDTIYALQDVEDDALIGVKSTARLFGERARPIVGLFYAGALALWLAAGLTAGGGWLLALLVVPAALLAWQVWTLQMGNPADALRKFRSNHWVGISVTLVLLAEALRLGLAAAA